ncbi:hypothetical protein [Rufibacter roseolus]|uniref:hypothetical protein n=1 Tax=Rufibacter roseolus TaxID=2817375 RepID=UPI001B30E7D1|nr:hypothetical protein [Rufibacter roseolus]
MEMERTGLMSFFSFHICLIKKGAQVCAPFSFTTHFRKQLMTLEDMHDTIARVFDVPPERLRYNFQEFSHSMGSLEKFSLQESLVEETFHHLDGFVFEFHLEESMRLALISAVSFHLGRRLTQIGEGR